MNKKIIALIAATVMIVQTFVPVFAIELNAGEPSAVYGGYTSAADDPEFVTVQTYEPKYIQGNNAGLDASVGSGDFLLHGIQFGQYKYRASQRCFNCGYVF